MTTFLLPRRHPHEMHDEWRLIEEWRHSTPESDEGVIRDWEQAVAEFVSMPHAAAISSGRAGMTLILEHLGLEAGDEVIVPAYTLKDLLPLIQKFGAALVPADIDPETLNVTADTVATRITDRTKAVIVLHAFGAPAPMAQILEVADAAGLPVIEDAAHALGAALHGRPAGAFGYAAFFSFETTKPVNTYGGGIVVSHDASLIDYIHEQEARKPFGLETVMHRVKATQREAMLMRTGLAFPLLLLLANQRTQPLISAAYRRAQQLPPSSVRYSPLQARIGLAKLSSLPQRIEGRRELVSRYESLLSGQAVVQRCIEGAVSTWYFCVARLPCEATPIRMRMLLRGVDAGVGNEISDNCAALLGHADCPGITDVFPRLMALPLSDSLTEGQVRRAAGALRACLPNRTGR